MDGCCSSSQWYAIPMLNRFLYFVYNCIILTVYYIFHVYTCVRICINCFCVIVILYIRVHTRYENNKNNKRASGIIIMLFSINKYSILSFFGLSSPSSSSSSLALRYRLSFQHRWNEFVDGLARIRVSVHVVWDRIWTNTYNEVPLNTHIEYFIIIHLHDYRISDGSFHQC